MDDVIVTDEQIGTVTDKAKIVSWPVKDLEGNRNYTRTNCTRKMISPTEFVVIPPGADNEEMVIRKQSDIDAAAAAAAVEAQAEVAVEAATEAESEA